MTVIDLTAAREARHPHMTGAAQCLCCRHEWTAVAPVGTTELQCPECNAYLGIFTNPPIAGAEQYQCNCGSQHFRIARSPGRTPYAYCARCAAVADYDC